MKYRAFIIFLSLFLIGIITACENDNNNKTNNSDTLKTVIESNNEKVDTTSNQAETIDEDNDYTAKYVCPVHCEGSGSQEAGNCKVCKMELIENLD